MLVELPEHKTARIDSLKGGDWFGNGRDYWMACWTNLPFKDHLAVNPSGEIRRFDGGDIVRVVNAKLTIGS